MAICYKRILRKALNKASLFVRVRFYRYKSVTTRISNLKGTISVHTSTSSSADILHRRSILAFLHAQ